MPVQDNDDKRTADQPAVDAEELRRKQAQSREQQQDETSVQKSGKLLPLLNAKAEHHQSRIDLSACQGRTAQKNSCGRTIKVAKVTVIDFVLQCAQK